jgi:hypothetical protein
MSRKKAIADMHDETGLELREGVYYFRMKMPADLRPHVKRSEVRISLRTKDKAQAKRLNAERRAVQYREWDELRERIKNGPRTSITTDEIQHILDHFLASYLAFDEADRMRGINPSTLPPHLIYRALGRYSPTRYRSSQVSISVRFYQRSEPAKLILP